MELGGAPCRSGSSAEFGPVFILTFSARDDTDPLAVKDVVYALVAEAVRSGRLAIGFGHNNGESRDASRALLAVRRRMSMAWHPGGIPAWRRLRPDLPSGQAEAACSASPRRARKHEERERDGTDQPREVEDLRNAVQVHDQSR